MLEVHQGSLKIGVVELVRDTPSKWSEFSSLKNDWMEEGHDVDHGSPVLMLNSLKEILGDQWGEGLVETSLDTFWRFIGNLDTVLEKEEWEVIGLFDS